MARVTWDANTLYDHPAVGTCEISGAYETGRFFLREDGSPIFVGNTAAPDRHNTRQFLSSWSRNVESWTEARGFPVLVLRYEDLLAEPETWFGKLLQALGAQPDPARLTRSIRHASFQSLQAQEAAAGFVERPDHAERFFHSGQAGGWKTELTAAQVARIRADHGPMMQRFGYF